MRPSDAAQIGLTSYRGRHAELYDVFYRDKPYDQEAIFVHQILQAWSVGRTHRLLELACGTGTHALRYEKLGYDVTALDYSPDMIAAALAKAAEVNSTVRFLLQDMRSLEVEGAEFDAAVCLFDSIGYVQTNEGITQVLSGVHSGLRESGLFVFEFWHAGAMLTGYDPVRVRRWNLADREIVRISETRLHCSEQVAEVRYDIYELRQDGTYTNLKEAQRNRYFLVQEMRMLLASCGFLPLKFYAGFSLQEDIDQNTWHVLAVARKSLSEGTRS